MFCSVLFCAQLHLTMSVCGVKGGEEGGMEVPKEEVAKAGDIERETTTEASNFCTGSIYSTYRPSRDCK